MNGATTLADAIHVVHQALTPVFLLSGIGALLNVFATRLERVADQADVLAAKLAIEPGRDQPPPLDPASPYLCCS